MHTYFILENLCGLTQVLCLQKQHIWNDSRSSPFIQFRFHPIKLIQTRETYARLLAAEIGARMPGDLREEQGADIKLLKKDTAALRKGARSMLSMLEAICEKLHVDIPRVEEEKDLNVG